MPLFRFRLRAKSGPTVPSTLRVLMPDGTVEVMVLEEYLRGVVPVEMGRSRPLEALKAQAIAARTYAATSHAHSAQGADICTTQHCQVWRNVNYPTTDLAVSQTKGQVVVYGGEIARTYYFAHCDGQTRNVADVWRTDLPYCRAVPCICGFTTMYGHGVGMCQEGASAMASQGFTARDIITHYYSGVEILNDNTPSDTAVRQAAVAKYLVSHPDVARFLGAAVPGAFMAADGNWIEFFEAGALAVPDDGIVSQGPVGAWIASHYTDRGSRPFQPALPHPGVDGRYVDRTRHNLSRFFLRHWQTRWGDPVSEEFYIVVQGEPVTHQLFEYALISHDVVSNEPLRSTRLSEVFLSVLDGGPGLTLLGDFVA
ncbi:MAG: SpoIID/LytB domain-containing protein [Anaerolineae bacterium]|nr:SpoIID/LytB domain-containing protein [Anaerolineae bacterium]